MEVTQVVFENSAKYPYRYRIDLPVDRNHEIIQWAKDTGFKCVIAARGAYVHTEEDAAFFVLRWA